MNARRIKLAIFVCVSLVVVTAALYSPVGSHPFINFDDDRYVTGNAHVQAGLTWNTFQWAWMATEESNWHPLTWLSHAFDCELYGLNPGAHHRTNLVFHCVNVALLFLLLLRATGRMWRSLVVAALFALHPLNVESVAWVAERKNLLSTFFFLLALGAYGWYVRKPQIWRYLVVALLFALGLAAKPMVITLPFVLLLLDFWPLGRVQGWSPQQAKLESKESRRRARAAASPDAATQHSLQQLILEKLPLLALSAGSAAITLIAQKSAIRSLTHVPLSVRLENSIYSYAMYLWKTVWPVDLALYYPLHRLGIWQIGLALLFLAGVSALVWKQARIRPYLLTGWLFYLGVMVPVIGIVQVSDQAMADRYAYVSLMGIFVMLVWGAGDWAPSKALKPAVMVAISIAIFGGLAFFTWRQIEYWQSSVDLWTHTLQITDHNVVAENNLADALHALGRVDEALPHFQNAAMLQPRDPERHVNLAAALAENGRLQDAIQEYTIAAQLSADPVVQSRSCQSLGVLYSAVGDYAHARQSYQNAVNANPEQAADLIHHLSAAVDASPSAEGYWSLGVLFEASGQTSRARSAYEQALQLDPEMKPAEEALKALTKGR